MLVSNELRPIISRNNDDSANEVHEMKYLILHVTEDEGKKVQSWELVEGRQAVVDAVYTILKENGYYNFFRSNILSEKVNMNKSISAYTFIRRFLETGDVTLEGWGIETAEDFSDYIFDEFNDDADYQGITNLDELDKFYNADIHHKTMFDIDKE